MNELPQTSFALGEEYDEEDDEENQDEEHFDDKHAVGRHLQEIVLQMLPPFFDIAGSYEHIIFYALNSFLLLGHQCTHFLDHLCYFSDCALYTLDCISPLIEIYHRLRL